MDDTIVIKGLEIKTSVGIHDWEYQIHQLLLLDIELRLDLRQAGGSDVLNDTVDYQIITALATEVAEEKHHALIEHYSERLARRILRFLPAVKQLSLAVSKPGAIAGARTVSVHIHRRTEDYQA